MAVVIDPLTTLGTTSAVAKVNSNLVNLAAEFAKLIYKDGTEEMNADLDMNGHNFLNVGEATSGGGFVTLAQLETILASIAETFVTITAFATAEADVFTGNGTQTQFVLSANPATQNNLDVSIGGVTQTPGLDYFWTGGLVVTFAIAPPVGETVLIKYMRGVPVTGDTFLTLNRSISFFFTNTPTSDEVLAIYPCIENFTIPNDFAGSQFSVGTNPTVPFEISVRKNNIQFGTLTILADGSVTPFTTASAEAIVAGDKITFHAPNVVSATIKDIGVSIRGVL